MSHAGPGCRVQHGCEGAGHHWFTPNGAVRTWHQLGRVGGAVHWVSHFCTSGLMAREQSALPALCNCDVGVHKRVLSALLVVLAAITQLTFESIFTRYAGVWRLCCSYCGLRPWSALQMCIDSSGPGNSHVFVGHVRYNSI